MVNNNSKLIQSFLISGSPYREFLHSDDLADALLFMILNYSDSLHLNVGTGKDITIKELAELIKDIIGINGDIEWDISKPDGTPKKLLDVSRLNAFGWKSCVSLMDGIDFHNICLFVILYKLLYSVIYLI